MNLTYFQPRKTRNEENNNNSPLGIRFVAKTSDLMLKYQKWQHCPDFRWTTGHRTVCHGHG